MSILWSHTQPIATRIARMIEWGNHRPRSVFQNVPPIPQVPKRVKRKSAKSSICSMFSLIVTNSDAVLMAAVPGFHELLIIFPHQTAFIALKYPKDSA